MRILVEHGADSRFVHHGDTSSRDAAAPAFSIAKMATTALMAAVGMGGGTPWVQPERGDREAVMLEAVTLIVEQGVDVNAANTDGRTALDAARALKYESVVQYLQQKGAKSRGSQQQ